MITSHNQTRKKKQFFLVLIPTTDSETKAAAVRVVTLNSKITTTKALRFNSMKLGISNFLKTTT